MPALCDCENCQLKGLFFSNVEKNDIISICSFKIEKDFFKGDIIVNQGDEIREFLYMKTGLAKLVRKTPSNKEQIITIAKPFDFINLFSIFSEKKYNYSIIALENTTVCTLELGNVINLMKTNALFSSGLLEKMSSVSDIIILEMLKIREKHLRGRIAYILLYFSNHIYQNENYDLPLSRKEIAEYIGMTTENVIRILSEFRQDKLIRINGKNLELLNKDKLQQICELG